MARSVWKGPFVDGYMLGKAERARASGRNEIIKIWSRRSTILPQFVGLTFGVYNGHKFLPVQVNENMVADAHVHRPRGRQEGEAGMSKPKAPRPVAENEAQCVLSNLRTSPEKLNLVAGLIRNQPASKAVATLTFSKRRIALAVRKTLESAIANAENNHQLDVDQLVVTHAEVGKAIVMRRFHARGRGRSSQIEKFFSHLKIVVAEMAPEDKPARAPRRPRGGDNRTGGRAGGNTEQKAA